jgi:apolipoprotein D and lipocalin family protein
MRTRSLAMARVLRLTFTLFAALAVAACSAAKHAPLETVKYVDLERFMGDWYVIANIPTSIERDAYNAVESYELAPDGTIRTTFTFREGGFDGKEKRYTPRGFVLDRHTNARWGMQFVWPIKADYRIVYLSDDYSQTAIGRTKRDYVWIMARTPRISIEDFERIKDVLAGVGYDVREIRHVPQRWD